MAVASRRRCLHVLVLVVACAFAWVAGCSSDEGTASNDSHAGSGNAGTGGSGADGGITLGDAANNQLTIDPPAATLTVTSQTTPATAQFKALWGSDKSQVTAKWALDTYDFGGIDGSGLFQTSGLLGGKATVNAAYAGQTATASVTVNVKLEQDVLQDPSDPGPNPANKTALQAAPQPDPGANENPPNPTRFLYPYDKTVMPKGLLAPLLQLSAGSLPPEDAKVALTSQYFAWTGYYKVQNPAQPQLAIPQAIWDAALQSTQGAKLTLEVTKASSGVAYGPYAIEIVVAAGSLKGAVYYQTYEQPNNGLWVTRPGTQLQAQQLKQGCVVCHSVSANGKRLSTGAEDALAAESGVYDVDVSGGITKIASVPSGLGGDTRNLSFGVFTPDGKYVTRSQNNFWGGPNQLAWKIDPAQGLIPATVIGLGAEVSALLPVFSPDGKLYAFTNGPGETNPFGTVGRSVSVMQVSIDENAGAAGTLTFTNRQLAIDNGSGGQVTKYVTFLPDSDLIVLQESSIYYEQFDQMLPTYGPSGVPGTGNGRLYIIKLSTKEHFELATANTGNVSTDADHNYEPFALPVPTGGYFWVVFTSIREYGNTYTGSNVRKQLWVAAISPSWSSSGGDPSHPPFYLPTQTATKNERGFWALDPCKAEGSACQTGDECCAGCCRPSDPNDPQSAKTCTTCDTAQCKLLSEKCDKNEDCCFADTGVQCLAGYCSPPIPQ